MGARPSSFKKVEAKPDTSRQWSKQQEAIFDWFRNEQASSGHLVVRARAGSGKSTTILEGVERAPESNILLCAFNKKIAEELNGRLKNPKAVAKTLHAVGYAAVRRQWRGMPMGQGTERADWLTVKVAGSNTPFQIRKLVTLLHTKGREMTPLSPDVKTLTDLALFFDYVPDESWVQYPLGWVVGKAQEAMLYAAKHEPTFDIGIDFADMLYLPLVWQLLTPEYDLVVGDEAQDMNMAQLTMLQRLCMGRMCLVGDDRQCQPLDTLVRQDGWRDVSIGTLKPGDHIESFDRHGQVFIKSGRVDDVLHRHYIGDIVALEVGTKRTRCTPNHKWLVRWNRSLPQTWITYLMRQGTRYRVGQCQLFRAGAKTFGLSERARVERADEAWILGVHHSLEEALACEQIVAATYGLPEMVFFPPTTIRHFTQFVIDTVYDSFEIGELHRRATRCLEDHGRDEAYPIYTKANVFERRGRTTLFETQACNLIPELMMLPVAPDNITGHDKQDRHAVSWEPIARAHRLPFDGIVVSLDIHKYHKYVADGLVTCNSIYAFRGADTGSLDRLKRELNAVELGLTVTYRCGQSIVKEAQTLVPDIEAAPSNPEGEIRRGVREAVLLSDAQPGDFVLSRLNAPLVSLTLRFLRDKKRARMNGRDIGAGIRAILTRLKCFEATPIEDMLTRLAEWERKQVTKYAAYGHLALVERTRDQAGMIVALAEGAGTTGELLRQIDWLFVDVKEGDQILCSSIHKAKGLESDIVWLLDDTLYRRGRTPEETNVEYVAITRAKRILNRVQEGL